VRLRRATATAPDRRFLEQMLYEAATWRGIDADADVLRRPHVAVYVEGWGRDGDTGVVAEDEQGNPIGAAWFRFFDARAHGFGFVASDVPELTVAVRRGARGLGVGSALLDALILCARAARVRALSLSVEEENPAVRLYERFGFVSVARVANALTMQLDLDDG
jgi:ribosomal protein S18 acetylase RimI-like enzyme